MFLMILMEHFPNISLQSKPKFVSVQLVQVLVVVFNAERVILSKVQVLAPMVLKPRPIPVPTEIGYSLRRGRGGSLDCMSGVQTHSGPPVFLVPFRKDLARMSGTP